MKKVILGCLLVFSLVGVGAVAPQVSHAKEMQIHVQGAVRADGTRDYDCHCWIDPARMVVGTGLIATGAYLIWSALHAAVPLIVG